MHDQSLAELVAARATARVSASDLAHHFLDRIERFDAQLNSLITVCPERALRQARAVDAGASVGALAGLPILHKDLFCTRDLRTSCASRMLDNFVAPYDAGVVERLDAAGAVTLGKANMDEFAMGSSSETSYYGATRNPWDLTRVPGGSSGGSAAAVAAGLAPAATGTDTGGSIRQPAALCGVTGIKPTYGRVSRYGQIAFASSLDQAGCFARSAEDCAWLLAAMAGFDERDSTSAEQAVPDYVQGLTGDIAGLRIGLPRQYFSAVLDADMRSVIDAAVRALEARGATLVDIELPHTDLAVSAYYVLASAEASSNLARYDGVRYGYRCDAPQDLEDLYTRSRGEGFGREVQRRIMIGAYVLSAGYYDAYYLKAQRVRRLIAQDFTAAFEQVDLIAAPVTQAPAFQLNAKLDDPVAMYRNDMYTLPASLAGIPGMSVPAGFDSGLPVGLQLLAPWFEEGRLLNTGHALQQATDWHQQRPAGFA